MINWNDPTARARLAERLGPNGYNRAFAEHVKESTVATVNGYGIRPVMSRFGRLYQIDGVNVAYRTLDQARDEAAKLPQRHT